MLIAVLGATGRTGRKVVDHALARGHSVRALTRRREGTEERQNLTWVLGSSDLVENLEELIEGTDGVISAIGPRPGRERDTCSTATRSLIAAGVHRLVVVSGAGVTLPGDQKGLVDRVVSWIVRRASPEVFEDKVRELSLLRRVRLTGPLYGSVP